jgi:hypothetical protein
VAIGSKKFSWEFQELLERFTALFEMVEDKILLTISNIYFFNQSKGM